MAFGQSLPMVPWRYTAMNLKWGPRWGVDRRMSFFTVTDQFGQPQSWLSMQRKVCLAVSNFAQPNVLAIAGAVTGAAAGKGGGPLVECAGWSICKNHATERCNAYRALAYIGITAFILHLLGSMCAFVTCVTMVQEGNISKKKKKKQAQAAFNVMLAATLGNALVLLGSSMWMVSSGMIIQSLQNTAYYPFAGAFIGMYLNYGTLFFLFMAMVTSFFRYRSKSMEDAAETEALENYAQDDMMYGDMAYGDMPLMYDSMGNPVPMDPMLMGGAPPPNI